MKNEIEVYGFDNSEEFIEAMQIKRLERLKQKTLDRIEVMEIAEFCNRVNAYAYRIKALGSGEIVCKLYDTPNPDTQIMWLDSEFFGTDTECLTIYDPTDNSFKDLFVKLMLDAWTEWENENKMDFIESFGGAK